MTAHEGVQSTGHQWREFLRDPTNNRCVRQGSRSTGDPTLEWTYETDGGIWSSPVVADGVVYIGSYDKHLYALSAETGELLWRYRTGAAIDGSPAVHDGFVYIGSHDRNIYALDAASGDPAWMYGTRGVVRGSPTVRNDTLFMGAHCNYEVCVSFYDIKWPRTGYLYAFDRSTGDLRWERELSTEGVTTTPAADDTFVYVTGGGEIVALAPETGAIEWEHAVQDTTFLASPVRAGDRVYAASNTIGEIVALDAATGERDWIVETDSVITATPLVCDGTMYAGTLDNRGILHALATEDGTEEWTFEAPAEGIGSSPVLFDGWLYVGTHNISAGIDNDPGVFAIDQTGKKQWSFHVETEANRGFGSSPAIVDDRLYIGGADGTVYAFAL